MISCQKSIVMGEWHERASKGNQWILERYIKMLDTQSDSKLDVSEEPEYMERNLRMRRSALYCSHNFKFAHPANIHHSCYKVVL